MNEVISSFCEKKRQIKALKSSDLSRLNCCLKYVKKIRKGYTTNYPIAASGAGGKTIKPQQLKGVFFQKTSASDYISGAKNPMGLIPHSDSQSTLSLALIIQQTLQ